MARIWVNSLFSTKILDISETCHLVGSFEKNLVQEAKKHHNDNNTLSPVLIFYIRNDNVLFFHEIIDIARSSLRRILQSDGWKPYKPTKVQELTETNRLIRLNFARLINRKNRENPNFSRDIMFVDEAMFTERGVVNKQNVRQYGRRNPYWTWPLNFQRKFRVMRKM